MHATDGLKNSKRIQAKSGHLCARAMLLNKSHSADVILLNSFLFLLFPPDHPLPQCCDPVLPFPQIFSRKFTCTVKSVIV